MRPRRRASPDTEGARGQVREQDVQDLKITARNDYKRGDHRATRHAGPAPSRNQRQSRFCVPLTTVTFGSHRPGFRPYVLALAPGIVSIHLRGDRGSWTERECRRDPGPGGKADRPDS